MTEQGSLWLRELFALTERAGESAMSLAARSRHVDLLLELDDLAGADIAIETLERAAQRRAIAARWRSSRCSAHAAPPLEGALADASVLVAAGRRDRARAARRRRSR